jgi:hypothetical protein
MKKNVLWMGLSMLLAACGPEGGPEVMEEAAPAEQGEVTAFAGCSGSGCNYKDPNAMGCSADAVTRMSANILDYSGKIIGRVELRYSAACNAKWSRAYNYISFSTSAWMSDGSTSSPTVISGTMYGSGSSNQVYGNMYSGYSKACGQVAGYPPACTGAM